MNDQKHDFFYTMKNVLSDVFSIDYFSTSDEQNLIS